MQLLSFVHHATKTKLISRTMATIMRGGMQVKGQMSGDWFASFRQQNSRVVREGYNLFQKQASVFGSRQPSQAARDFGYDHSIAQETQKEGASRLVV